jgi:hypothetical protein
MTSGWESCREDVADTGLVASRDALPMVKATVRAIGENRSISVHDGRFEDDFGPHAVHLYQVVQ